MDDDTLKDPVFYRRLCEYLDEKTLEEAAKILGPDATCLGRDNDSDQHSYASGGTACCDPQKSFFSCRSFEVSNHRR